MKLPTRLMDKDNQRNIVSFNCKGINSSTVEIQKLCEKFNIIFLQETWLPKQKLETLASISPTHNGAGTCNVDYQDNYVIGRPYGGTAVLWNKSLNAKVLRNSDSSLTGLQFTTESNGATQTVCIINVYLPYCAPHNMEEHLQYLGTLQTFCEELNTPNICILGDFNAGSSNFLVVC